MSDSIRYNTEWSNNNQNEDITRIKEVEKIKGNSELNVLDKVKKIIQLGKQK